VTEAVYTGTTAISSWSHWSAAVECYSQDGKKHKTRL